METATPVPAASNFTQHQSQPLPDLTCFDEVAEQLLPTLKERSDDELISLIHWTERAEQFTFVLRGACVVELRRRFSERLAQRSVERGVLTTTKRGARALIKDLARNVDRDPKTLDTDARIFNEFFPDLDLKRLARESLLPREAYVIALGAPDPSAALAVARLQIEKATYRRDEFRAYVNDQKRGAISRQVAKKRGATTSRCSVCLSPRAHNALRTLAQERGVTPDELIERLLIEAEQARGATGARLVGESVLRHNAQRAQPASDPHCSKPRLLF